MITTQRNTLLKLRTKVADKFCYQQPYTPPELIEEITNRITVPKTSSMLVLYTIEWALYLRHIGFTDITVGVLDEDRMIKSVCSVFEIKYITLRDTKKDHMKFDVVVGNPPYQTETNSTFYKQFVKLSKELADTVVLIVPSSNFKDLNEFRGLTHYKYLVNAFEGIQVLASWFIWKRGYLGGCNIVTPTAEASVSQFHVAPTNNIPGFNLTNRVIGMGLLGFEIQSGSLTRNRVDPDENGVWCIWSAGYTNQEFDKIKVSVTLQDQLAGFGKHKVVFSGDHTPYAIGPAKYAGFDHGCAMKAHFIEVNSEDEAENLIQYLSSKFIKAVIPVIKGTSTKNGKTVFRLMPTVDLTRPWTDAELYAHFGLTQDEIDYIESTVK